MYVTPLKALAQVMTHSVLASSFTEQPVPVQSLGPTPSVKTHLQHMLLRIQRSL